MQMKSSKLLLQLVDRAVEFTVNKFPTISTGYSVDNITSSDVERLLWYAIQNVDDIANDSGLREKVIACAKQGTQRVSELNEFLHLYFETILSESGEKDLDAACITEEDTFNILEYVLLRYPLLYNDDVFLQGTAMLSHISHCTVESRGYKL